MWAGVGQIKATAHTLGFFLIHFRPPFRGGASPKFTIPRSNASDL